MTLQKLAVEDYHWLHRVPIKSDSKRYVGTTGSKKIPTKLPFTGIVNGKGQRVTKIEIRNEGTNTMLTFGGLEDGLRIMPGCGDSISAEAFQYLVNTDCIHVTNLETGDCYFQTGEDAKAQMWLRWSYINC